MKDKTKYSVFYVIMLILLAISMYFTIIEYQKAMGAYKNEFDLYLKEFDLYLKDKKLYKASSTGKIIPIIPTKPPRRGVWLIAALVVETIVILYLLARLYNYLKQLKDNSQKGNTPGTLKDNLQKGDKPGTL